MGKARVFVGVARNASMSRARSAAIAAAVAVAMAITPAIVPGAASAEEFALRAATPNAAAAFGAGPRAGGLSPADIAAVLPSALALWGASDLAGATVRIGDVSGGRLAVTSGRTITIDADAAGRGWFVDATPSTSSEFSLGSGDSARAAGSSPAAGRFDLQTVLAHEIGHLLGRADVSRSDAIMHESLRPGERHLDRGADAGARDSVLRALRAGAVLPLTAAMDAVGEPIAEPAPSDPAAPEPADDGTSTAPAPPTETAEPAAPASTDPAPAETAPAAEPAPADPAPADPAAEPAPAVDAAVTLVDPAAADAIAPAPWTVTVSGRIVVRVEGGDLVIGQERRPLASVTALSIFGSGGDDEVVFDAAALAALAGIAVSFAGGGGADTLAGPSVDTRWIVTGAGSGAMLAGGASVSFAGVEQLQGAAGSDDTFVIEAAGSIAGVDGGPGGFDTISVASGASGSVASLVTGPQSGVVTRDGDTTTYGGLEPVDVVSCTTCLVTAGNGGHGIRVSMQGNEVWVEFTDGSGETHRITATAALNLTVRGGTGDDTITVGELADLVTLVIEGGAGIDSLIGPDVATDWVIDAAGAGATGGFRFSQVENVAGGTGDDVFALMTGSGGTIGSLAGSVTGGGGSDTLVGHDFVNTWTISGADAGTLTWVAAPATLSFTGVGTLIGGSAADTFAVLPGGTLTGGVDGGAFDAASPALDVLDFSALGGAIVVILAGGAVDIETAFSASTAAGDPGSGAVRFDNAVQNQSTQIRVDILDAAGTDIAAAIDRIDTSHGGGQLLITDANDPTKWILF
ncbi:MAG: cya 4, partial [Microbacterium sp.]|nr:cya 4 [Microbacterium sp.]